MRNVAAIAVVHGRHEPVGVENLVNLPAQSLEVVIVAAISQRRFAVAIESVVADGLGAGAGTADAVMVLLRFRVVAVVWTLEGRLRV